MINPASYTQAKALLELNLAVHGDGVQHMYTVCKKQIKPPTLVAVAHVQRVARPAAGARLRGQVEFWPRAHHPAQKTSPSCAENQLCSAIKQFQEHELVPKVVSSECKSKFPQLSTISIVHLLQFYCRTTFSQAAIHQCVHAIPRMDAKRAFYATIRWFTLKINK